MATKAAAKNERTSDVVRAKEVLTLYELSDEQLALDALVDMDDSEWKDEHEQLYVELIERMATKADDTGRFIRTREALAETIKLEEKRLKARREAIEKRLKRLKEYLVFAMQRMSRLKIEGDMFTLAVQNNPASVKVGVAPEELPEQYTRLIPAELCADKALILEALKQGTVVAGCELEQGAHLRVR